MIREALLRAQRILKRRSHYRAVFAHPSAPHVLADLKRFCRGMSSPAQFSPQSGMIDPVATGIAIGRQEVWLRIATHLHIQDGDLVNLKEEANDEA